MDLRINAWLKFVFPTGFFLIFITSIVWSNEFKSGELYAREAYFITSSAIISCLFIVFMMIKPQAKIIVSNLDLFMALFVLYFVVRFLANSESTSLTYWDLLITFYLLLLYYATRVIFREQGPGSVYVIWAFIIVGALNLILGFFQGVGLLRSSDLLFKITGSFANPGPYAGYISSIFPMSLALVLYGTFSHSVKKGALILMAITVYVLIVCGSRASWIAITAGSALVLLPWLIRFGKSFRRYWLLYIMVLLLGMVVSHSVFLWKEESARGRLLNWKIAMQIARDNTLVGVGTGKYQSAHQSYQILYFQNKQGTEYEKKIAGTGDYAFNDYIEILVENGVFGLSIVLIFLFLVAKDGIVILQKCGRDPSGNQNINIYRLGALGGLASILTFGFFSYPKSVLAIAINFSFLVGILHSMDSGTRSFSIKNNSFFRLGFLLIITSISLFALRTQKMIRHSLNDWLAGSELKAQGKFEGSIEKMEKAYPVLENEKYFIWEYGEIFFLNENYEKSIAILEEASKIYPHSQAFEYLGRAYQKLGKFEKAEENLYKAHYSLPYKFGPQYYLFKLYTEVGQKEEAQAKALEIIEMPEKNPSIPVKLMKEEMKDYIKMQNKSKDGFSR